MDDRIKNARLEIGYMTFFADHKYWLQVYTIDEDGEKDYHMLELSSYDEVIRFKRMIQNVQTPKTEQDTIFVGAYGPILEVEEQDAE